MEIKAFGINSTLKRDTMRMWMLPAMKFCRKHLLGEHVETHMLMGNLKSGKSISGFIEKGLLEPESLLKRHDELAAEMIKRGFEHRSPLVAEEVAKALSRLPVQQRRCRVDLRRSATDLSARCAECGPFFDGLSK